MDENILNELENYSRMQDDECGEALEHLLLAYSRVQYLQKWKKLEKQLETALMNQYKWYKKNTKINEGDEEVTVKRHYCELLFKGQDY